MSADQGNLSGITANDVIDIIDTVEESLEIAISALDRNRVFVERHFPHHGLYVQGNKREMLMAFGFLLHNAIGAMDGLSLQVLRVGSVFHPATHSIAITLQIGGVVARKNNNNRYWVEVARKILLRQGGEITIGNHSGQGQDITIEFSVIAVALTLFPKQLAALFEPP